MTKTRQGTTKQDKTKRCKARQAQEQMLYDVVDIAPHLTLPLVHFNLLLGIVCTSLFHIGQCLGKKQRQGQVTPHHDTARAKPRHIDMYTAFTKRRKDPHKVMERQTQADT